MSQLRKQAMTSGFVGRLKPTWLSLSRRELSSPFVELAPCLIVALAGTTKCRAFESIYHHLSLFSAKSVILEFRPEFTPSHAIPFA